MFSIGHDTVLTTDLLSRMIGKFMLNQKPQLQKWKDYYDGRHAIINKSYTDENKTCNHVVTNFCRIVTDTYSGYIVGKPVSYVSNQNIEDLQDIINYNDSDSEDMQWLTNALIYGVAYELQWIDNYAQVRYSQVNPLQAFAIYDNTLNCDLLYFVRWYNTDTFGESNIFNVEVYDANTVKTYESNGLGGALTLINEEVHHFGDVPVSVFKLNEDEDNIFDCIVTLNDAYNELQSSEIDDFSAWVDAYLTLTGVDADKDDIASMRENRVLLLPNGAQADWLTKNASDTQIVNMLDNLRRNIFKVTSCPDMADETFLAQSGTALAYKLVGFENRASGIVAQFTKAIQRRVELICNVLNLKASDAVWRDIGIRFVRNLPVNLSEIIQIVNSLKGTVSDATLLSQIPFIDDVQAELEAVQKQKEANMSMFNFNTGAGDEDDELLAET